MASPSLPKVAILVGTSTGWGRRLIRSVLGYANAHGPWDIFLEPHGISERSHVPDGWKPDGIIARVTDNRMAEELAAYNTHVINVSSISIDQPIQRVTTDTMGLAEVAIRHFLDRGIRHFGYLGLARRLYSLERQNAFAKVCEAHGCPLEVYSGASIRLKGASRRERLKHWLAKLPRGCGLMTWGITQGVEAIAATQELGRLIPDDLAVLAGDNDDLLCQAIRPSLSGINVPAEQMGTESARQLDLLMRGALKPDPERETRFRPAGVIERASTEVLAIDDPDVVAAVRFIRSNADRPLRVSDVAEAVAVSRRSLERRFQRELRHTMGEEIAAVHLQRAKSLLEQTDLAIPRVAEASGYGSPEYMATVFRQATGVTPLKYRARVQGR